MASTPPSTTILATPPTPRHAGEASRHYGTRQSTRYTLDRSFATKTPPPPSRPQQHITEAVSSSTSKSLRSRQPVSPSSSSASPRSISSSAHTSPRKRSKPVKRSTKAIAMNEELKSSSHMPSQQQTDLGFQNGSRPPRSMLPTPASLPRKKEVPQREVQAAARVLFPSRPEQIDDAMPTPRKNRKGRKNVGFSLYSSMEENVDDAATQVQVYTDSRDKVPEVVAHEENPFMDNLRNLPDAEQNVAAIKNSKKRKHTREVHTNPHIEKAFNHDKGMVYVFRGKKIYKQFPQDSESEREESPTGFGEDTGVMDDTELSRLRPLTRSSLKPKLLFPHKKPQAVPTATALADEEALTEVEDRASLPPKQVTTPVKPSFGPASPPTTGRATRSAAQHSRADALTDHDMLGYPQDKPVSKKKISPFDSWQRTKPGRTASRGKKRDAEEMEAADSEDGKRFRSSGTTSFP